MRHIPHKYLIAIGATILLALLVYMGIVQSQLKKTYWNLASEIVYDRHGEPLSYSINEKGYRAEYLERVPKHVRRLLLRKEDRFFYVHPGINPVSTVRAIVKKIKTGRAGASSTLTQQLVKNLLGNENDRTIRNKLHEMFATLSLELFTRKKQILVMYANTVYLGHGNQGMERASWSYFGKPLAELGEPEILAILATLSSPFTQNPRTDTNAAQVEALAERLHVEEQLYAFAEIGENTDFGAAFEIGDLHLGCTARCNVSIDKKLTDVIRTMLRGYVELFYDRGVRTGAVVVISVPDNELLAVVGSPDPFSQQDGQAINMAVEPRPIGSTSKPFIYAKGFEAGLRPYTLVNDREYKYPVESGFSIYPKNFDGLYRGKVTLHEALTNSLNVPSVKTLEYVGTNDFYHFIEDDMGIQLLQPGSDYQYGAALGTLEIDPLTLAHMLTIFPNEGVFKPLSVKEGAYLQTPMGTLSSQRTVIDSSFTQLTTKLLSDRTTGAEQFGTRNNLSLPYEHYAAKTGTSRDFHDSWTIGYTPDFVVVVWLGNAENNALNGVTGHSGAGALWNDVMQYLLNSEYITKTPFSFDQITELEVAGELSYGLPGESWEAHRELIEDSSLITTPHDGDVILFDDTSVIPLVAEEAVTWTIDGVFAGTNTRIEYRPTKTGPVQIQASSFNNERTDSIEILITN